MLYRLAYCLPASLVILPNLINRPSARLWRSIIEGKSGKYKCNLKTEINVNSTHHVEDFHRSPMSNLRTRYGLVGDIIALLPHEKRAWVMQVDEGHT